MKDCGYAIRKAYVDKLASQSFSLGVYDTIAPDEVQPPFYYPSASPDFKIVTRRMSSNEATFDYVDEAYVFKRVIVFEHFVTQIL